MSSSAPCPADQWMTAIHVLHHGERHTTRDAWERSRDVTHRYNQRHRIAVRVWKLHVNAGLYRPTYAPNGQCQTYQISPAGSRSSDNQCASAVVLQVVVVRHARPDATRPTRTANVDVESRKDVALSKPTDL